MAGKFHYNGQTWFVISISMHDQKSITKVIAQVYQQLCLIPGAEAIQTRQMWLKSTDQIFGLGGWIYEEGMIALNQILNELNIIIKESKY